MNRRNLLRAFPFLALAPFIGDSHALHAKEQLVTKQPDKPLSYNQFWFDKDNSCFRLLFEKQEDSRYFFSLTVFPYLYNVQMNPTGEGWKEISRPFIISATSLTEAADTAKTFGLTAFLSEYHSLRDKGLLERR